MVKNPFFKLLPALLPVLLVWGAVVPQVHSHGAEKHTGVKNKEPVVLAPGYEPLEFDAPVPGSYKLPMLDTAADGNVVDSDNKDTTLAELMDGRITVLSFIYRACNDVNGCPLATYVLHQVRNRITEIPGLADRVRLVSMSFDPANDSPEAMADYKASFSDSSVDWSFVTPVSIDALRPVLDAYNQPISEVALSDGTATINHMLRVFLVDEKRNIRNIYSATLLHGETLFSDIQTLALEGSTAESETGASPEATSALLARALTQPEDRTGYASGNYTSQSLSVRQQGIDADLLSIASTPSLGLPINTASEQLTEAKIALGRRLFYDRRLSINDTFSCAMCHIPQQAFTSNELSTSVGVEGRTVKRNAPTLINVAFASRLFHDGRESSLEQQVWSPLLARNEMANPSIGYVIDKIAAIKEYQDGFMQVYQSTKPDMHTVGDAFAAYQRTLVAGNSAFDRWYFGGEENALSAQANAGFEIFNGKAGCVSCHSIAEKSALFTDEKLHNTGVGYAQSSGLRTEPHEVTLAPGVVVMVDPASYAAAAEKPPIDLGRYEVTLDPDDRWKFLTPGLRNVSLTAPYMHNGSIGTLEGVVDFYNEGGIANPVISPLMRPLGLTDDEKTALVHFLQSLVGDSIELLVNDGIAAPIGDL